MWGKVLFPLSCVPGKQRTRGCPLPTAARVPGKRQRDAPVEGPLGGVGCCVPRATGSGQPGCVVAWTSPPVPEMARRGAGAGWPGHCVAVMLGGGVGTFSPKPRSSASLGGLWLSPRHLGLLPAPWQGQDWEIQQGASALPKGGLLWAATLSSQVAIPHHGCPLLTQVTWRGVSVAGLPQSGKSPGDLGASTQRPSLARPSEG